MYPANLVGLIYFTIGCKLNRARVLRRLSHYLVPAWKPSENNVQPESRPECVDYRVDAVEGRVCFSNEALTVGEDERGLSDVS